MRQAHTRLLSVAAALIAGLLIGCRPTHDGAVANPRGGASAGALPALTVRVGYFPNVTHAPAVLGFSAADPFFERAFAGRVKFETKQFNAGPVAMEALHAGALDLCFVGPTPAINAHARAGDVVLVSNVANGGTVLVARAGTGIGSVEDLRGKRIAVPQIGNTQDAMLRHLLMAAGIRLKDHGGDTSVLPVDNPDIVALFQTGQLDAACVPEPWGARLEADLGAHIVLDWDSVWRGGSYPVTVLVARRAFLEANREFVREFSEQLALAVERIRSDQDAASALNAELKRLTGKELSIAVLHKALDRIEFKTEVSLDDLQAMADVMVEVGYAKEAADVATLVEGEL